MPSKITLEIFLFSRLCPFVGSALKAETNQYLVSICVTTNLSLSPGWMERGDEIEQNGLGEHKHVLDVESR